jgi:hypothetical protein
MAGPCRGRIYPARKGKRPMMGRFENVEDETNASETFRTVVYTGEHTQLTVMRLAPGEDIGREVHPHLDQFIRIEEGRARVELGASEDRVDEQHDVEDDWGGDRPGRRLAQRRQHRAGRREALLALLAAGASSRHGAPAKAEAQAAEHA